MKIAPNQKCNLQFPTQQLNYYLSNCGFTDEEKDVLIFRARGKSVVQIAFLMEEKTGIFYSVSTIERRIRRIKHKINTIDG